MHSHSGAGEKTSTTRAATCGDAAVGDDNSAPHSHVSCSSDGDVLRDAEAYLWNNAEGEESSADLAERAEVRIVALPHVCLGSLAADHVMRQREVFSDAWTEEDAGAAALAHVERSASVRLPCRGDALPHDTESRRSRCVCASAAMGPVAPHTVSRDTVQGGSDEVTACAVLTSTAVTDCVPPLLVAAAEEEVLDSGPANWMAYGGAAARAAASRAAAGATEMAAAQVPGGSLAVAAARKGAATVAQSRAAVPTASLSSLPTDAPLRASSGYARTAATEAATHRTQQLQLYVTQNFVPTLSDFVPGANAVAERAAAKTRAWATARVATTGVNAAAATAEVEVVELRVGASPTDTAPTPVTVEKQRVVCETEQDVAVAARVPREHSPSAPAVQEPQPQPLVETAAESLGSTASNIIPYATLRVFLCRSDGGARNGNNAVEAVAKFGRMPCKRKLQELASNFVYNLLPRTPDIGKGRSPYRELLVMQAQHLWCGIPSPETECASAACTVAPTTEECERDRERRRAASLDSTDSTSATSSMQDALRCQDGGDNVKRHTASANNEALGATSSSGPSFTVLNPLASSPPPPPTEPSYQAYMSYGHHTVLHNTRYGTPTLLPWTRECPFCCSAATCREGCCCLHCQLARQCNMLNYHRPTVLWPVCCLMCVLDPCTCFMCSPAVACVNRAMARARYGIDGCFLGDCLCALFCTRCMTAQVMDEMMTHGEYPGGICMLPPTSEPTATAMQ